MKRVPCHRRPPLALALLLVVGCAPGERLPLTTQVADWRDEVLYQIVVDRFDDGDPSNDRLDGVGPAPGDLARHQGGDWRGVTRRLGYLGRLGVTAIWLSPVVENVDRMEGQDGYHGYWAADFTRPNRRFGALEDLQRLVREAHRRGIKVIIDVVVNHTGRLFYYDLDGDGRPEGPELEPAFSAGGPYARVRWLTPRPGVFRYVEGRVEPEVVELTEEHFHRRGRTTDFNDQTQKELGDFPTGLRDLDTERPGVVRAMVDTCLRWVELTDVDGFRLDAVPHVPHAFWERFSRELRRALAARGKQRFLLLGEVFNRDPRVLASYTRAGLDAVFDFCLKWEVIDGVVFHGWPAARARRALEENRGRFPATPHPDGIGLPPWEARVAFADNHDLPRVGGALDDYAVELALAVVFTVDAIPSITYGTEQGLAGAGHAGRAPLWRAGFSESHPLYRYIARLAWLRRQLPALRRGALVVRHASEESPRTRRPGAGLLAWERVLGDRRILVAINTHPTDAAEASVPTGLAPGTRLEERLWAGAPAVVAADGHVVLRVPPRRAVVLAPR